jgi:hypothetical protein
MLSGEQNDRSIEWGEHVTDIFQAGMTTTLPHTSCYLEFQSPVDANFDSLPRRFPILQPPLDPAGGRLICFVLFF